MFILWIVLELASIDTDFCISQQWSDDLARLARARNQLSCMLPPTGDTVIYERVENKCTYLSAIIR